MPVRCPSCAGRDVSLIRRWHYRDYLVALARTLGREVQADSGGDEEIVFCLTLARFACCL